MMTTLARTASLAVAVTLLSSCSGGAGHSSTASSICHSVSLPGTLSSWTGTTIGAVRTLTIGIQRRPRPQVAHAFRGSPGAQDAAWCWTQLNAQTYAAYAATTGEPALFIEQWSGVQRAPTGSPANTLPRPGSR